MRFDDDALSRIGFHDERLRSYSDLGPAEKVRVYDPKTCADLKAIFAHANSYGKDVPEDDRRCVTIRGGGHAFDSQSIGTDIVVSMRAFNDIVVLPDDEHPQVRVGGGATWGAIVKELQAAGLVPAGTVTSSHATAGGTLSSDCLSRFSPRYGKEARSVAELTIITPDGTEYRCTRPENEDDVSDWTMENRLFMGAIGGFGYLGAVVSVLYCVERLPDKRAKLRTTITKHTDFGTLVSALIPATQRSGRARLPHGTDRREERSNATEEAVAVWAGLYPAGRREPSWMLFEGRFTNGDFDSLRLNQRRNPGRIVGEWGMRSQTVCRWLSSWFFDHTESPSDYADDIGDFLFFMDANTRSKHWARKTRVRRRLPVVQQTFIVPLGADLEGWLKGAHELFHERHLAPTIQDILYLPRDDAFCLSPNRAFEGFAVSYACEVGKSKVPLVKSIFTELAYRVWHEYGGRVSLVKNVCAPPALLEEMYGGGADEFFALKREVDPACILRNDFLERTFGELLTSKTRVGGSLRDAVS